MPTIEVNTLRLFYSLNTWCYIGYFISIEIIPFRVSIFSGSDSVFPDCIEVNRSVVLPVNDLDAYKQVFKAYSADVCAKKAKKEEDQIGFTEQKVMWVWYSTTTECVIYVFVNDSIREQAPLQIGRFTL